MKRSVCLGLLSALFVFSQPPTPVPPKATQNNQGEKKTNSAITNGTQPSVNTPSVPSLNKEESEKEGSKKSNAAPSDWWLIIPTIVIAGAALLQLFIYFRQADYMKRGLRISMRQTHAASMGARAATKSAQSAEKTARDAAIQFELAQRPWLTLSVTALSDITYGPNGVSITIRCDVVNSGKTPAISMQATSRLHIFENGTKADLLMKSICVELGKSGNHSYTVFPNSTYSIEFPLNLNRNELQASMRGSNYIELTIASGVSYTSTFDAPIYCTATLHRLAHFDGTKIWSIVRVDEQISMDSIRIQQRYPALIGEVDVADKDERNENKT